MLQISEKRGIRRNGFAILQFGAWKHPTAVGRRVFPSGYQQAMHFHDSSQVWYCHEGFYRHQIGHNVYDCGKGSLIVVPAGVFHGFIIPEDQEADLFCIETMHSLFMATPQDRYVNAAANLLLPCFSKELGYTFPECYYLGPESQLLAGDYLSELSLMDFRTCGTAMDIIYDRLEDFFSLPEVAIPEEYQRKAIRLIQHKARPILRAIDYINNNYSKKIVAEDLLRVATLCHTDFYRCFRRFQGLTFSAYHQQLRIARVQMLLHSTTYSFTKIAELCGFSDAAHMSKCYKKETGTLMKDVRAASRRPRPAPPQEPRVIEHRLRYMDTL